MAGNSSLNYLPWIRSRLGADSRLSNGQREAAVQVKIEDAHKQVVDEYEQSFTLKGPGDVLGFNPLMVARTVPAAGENDFEPNYFPYLEFIDPDFPWRYTLDGAGSDGKLKPWLALIVLKKEEFAIIPDPGERRPGIRVLQASGKLPLPDLEQSWAWAHLQIAGEITSHIELYILENPDLHCSRLMSPRKLQPHTSYTAFVVPAYEAGRRAGLGEEIGEYTIAPAWSGDMDSIRLPVYYQWEFYTSEEGDFAELLGRLDYKPIPVDEEGFAVGTRPVDGSRPGYFYGEDGLEKTYQDAIITMEGALAPPGFMTSENRKAVTPGGFTDDLRESLNIALQEAPDCGQGEEDPLVSIPVYGRYFQNTRELKPPDNNGRWAHSRSWADELNVDPRGRISASIGGRIVQHNQEEYMKESWEQAGEIREANEQLRFGALGKMVSERLKKRHIDPLDDNRLALITQPFHHYFAYNTGNGQRSFKEGFKYSGLPGESLSYVFKRVISQKVGLARPRVFEPWGRAVKNKSLWRLILRVILYIFRLLVELIIALVERPELLARFILPPDDGSEENKKESSRLLAVKKVVLAALLLISNGKQIKKWFLPLLYRLLYLLRVPAPGEKPRVPIRDVKLAEKLKRDFDLTLEISDIYPLKTEIIGVTPIDINKLLRPCLDMRADLLERLNTIINVPWLEQLDSFDPIMKAPRIESSLYRHLGEHSLDLLVPGLGLLDNNMVVMMEENSKFIEGFMVGANHEMGRELLWRKYPTDQRGTIFRNFWDPIDEHEPDIKDIHKWDGGLGANSGRRSGEGEKRIVLTIKADLIRRYPNTMIFAIKKKADKEWAEILGKIDENDSSKVVENINGELHTRDGSFSLYPPVFSAQIEADILFLGFPFSAEKISGEKQDGYNYYFVFMEHPALPRFGLAVQNQAGNMISEWNQISWEQARTDEEGWLDAEHLKSGIMVNPGSGPPSWAVNSAGKAWITYQKPTRAVVPADRLIPN